MAYNPYSPYASAFEDDQVWQILLPFLFIFLGIVLIISFVLYLFMALGLYKMAKNAGLQNPWLAFIPVGNYYPLGKLAERASWAGSGKTLPYAQILLWGYLLYMGGGMITAVFPLIAFLMLPISIGFVVFMYMAMYYIYKDYGPDNAIVFLILSILFGLQSFFLFALRNRVPVSVAGRYPRKQPDYQPYAGPGAPPAGPGPQAPGSYQAPGGYTAPGGPVNPINQGPYTGYQPPYPPQPPYQPYHPPYGGPSTYTGAPAPRPFNQPPAGQGPNQTPPTGTYGAPPAPNTPPTPNNPPAPPAEQGGWPTPEQPQPNDEKENQE